MVDGGTNTDTIVLTATAAALNVSADSQIVNVEAISAATALAGVSINLSAQTEAFTITGGTSADTLTGGAGNDALIGGAGTDTLTGGAGADTFNVDAGTDSITDLATGDNLVVSAGATAIANVSTFTATASTTNAGTATLNALAAGSTIDMRLADGVNGFNLVGGAGVDTLTGSVNADTISGGAGVDAINMGAGNNVAVVNAVVGTSSNSGRVTVANNANDTGQDTITGFNLANDTLKIAATNVINFVHAADTAVGTAGATDTGVASSFTALTGLVELNQTTNNNWSDAGDVAVTFVSPIGTFNLTSFQARLQYNLTGTSANNTIATGVLDDTITGGAGSDTLTGGAGADSFVFNAVVGTSSNSINLVKDTVTDFVTGIDTVLIRATNVNNFSVSTDVGATAGGSGIYSADLNHNGTLTDLGDVQFISTVAIATNLAAQNATRVDLIGTTGADTLSGGINSDTLAGGSGADTLTGGAGADTLTGGLGADTFVWKLGDGGSIGIPVTDAITDFNVASVALGGDVLDLRDLLVSENTGILANYLHFEYTGGNTIVHVSSTGQFSPTFSQANDVQTITLTGVNLVQSFADDNAIIQDLLTKQKLITD
jgi:Ca2+-binding RTX toxin-like protein